MHLLVAKPGGYTDETAVIQLQQTPGDVVVLSAADTDLAILAEQADPLSNYAQIRLANLGHLRNHTSVDLYADEVLKHARVIIATILGGYSYWQYLVDRLTTLATQTDIKVILLSGTDQFDQQLQDFSNQPESLCRNLWAYQRNGGPENARSFLAYVLDKCLDVELPQSLDWQPPKPLPKTLLYKPSFGAIDFTSLSSSWIETAPVVAVLFYRAHYQSGNVQVIDQLCSAMAQRRINCLPIALTSLKDDECLAVVNDLLLRAHAQLIINTTSFAMSDPGQQAQADWCAFAVDVPVIQTVFSSSNREDWEAEMTGLSPRDLAMHVVLPELDGRVISRAISFKGELHYSSVTQMSVSGYKPHHERIEWVCDFAEKTIKLRQTLNQDKKIALILANYPTREGRIGNGVGLDTPASTLNILKAMATSGYQLGTIPSDGNALMDCLLEGTTNDIDMLGIRKHAQWLDVADYEIYFSQINEGVQKQLIDRWGEPANDPMVIKGAFCIAGIQLGNVFVGIQPARGYHIDLNASYHDPDLIPPHAYLAYYFWLGKQFQMDAVIHVGKHGNLEWLPGKSIMLSRQCWPDIILGPIPHFYPFIVNDPGEGSQAKRRTQAVIIDHLMPPLMRAETYGELVELEKLVDEYYDAMSLDPKRSELLRSQILIKCQQDNLLEEIRVSKKIDDNDTDQVLNKLDAYLCELKESQIRDGLHIFGQSPAHESRVSTLLALSRLPIDDGKLEKQSLIKALSIDFGFDKEFDPLSCDMSRSWHDQRPIQLLNMLDSPWRTNGDTRERLELFALDILFDPSWQLENTDKFAQSSLVLKRIHEQVAPSLDVSGDNELAKLLTGLQGRFVPPGPSGAPSRGRVDVLPTGRNFYSVDMRAVPTPTAWQIGFKTATGLIERYVQDHGEYPKSIGISVWGTATMRTGGDDIAQALALIGVKPKWAMGSNRVQDFEVLPVSLLNRPRVDVTLRVSGFFRDAFMNVINYFDAAVEKVAQLDEDELMNPIRARIGQETIELVAQGVEAEQAKKQAGWRVFGSKPGAYGAGLQGLIDQGIWDDRADLAQAYTNWGGYAYGRNDQGTQSRELFKKRLSQVDAVHQNQDNREHDILDSDDYYQFQGGMSSAVEHYSGEKVAIYHGDTSHPENPKIRSLKEEISRVIRSRVVNPKWMQSIQKHGYKGAFELAATVDYLFAYDATTNVVEDYQYQMVADAYLLDDEIRQFLGDNNPDALREMSERLIEAMDRDLWQRPGDMREQIESIMIDAENLLER